MEKILWLIASYMPFQFALNPAPGVDLASIRVLILILFFVWLAKGLKNKKIQIRNTLQTWLVASFLFFNFLSFVAARNTDWSLRKLAFLFSVFPVYFVVSDIINTPEKARKIIKALVISGTAIAAIGILQFFTQFIFGVAEVYQFWADYVVVPFLGGSFGLAVLEYPSWLVNIGGRTVLRATAFFPDPHMLSFYLGMLIPFAFAMAVREKEKFFWIICASILLIADLFSFSRGGYLGLLAGVLTAVAMSWNQLGKRNKIAVSAAIAILAIVLTAPNPFSKRFFSSFNLQEGSNQGRLVMWEKAAEIIQKKPILGTGIGNFSLEIKPTAGYREPFYAHNTYLDIAAETGVINMLVWISLLTAAMANFYNKRQKNGILAAGAISLIIFSAHSIVETAIYSPVVLTLFLIIIAISNINNKNEKAC